MSELTCAQREIQVDDGVAAVALRVDRIQARERGAGARSRAPRRGSPRRCRSATAAARACGRGTLRARACAIDASRGSVCADDRVAHLAERVGHGLPVELLGLARAGFGQPARRRGSARRRRAAAAARRRCSTCARARVKRSRSAWLSPPKKPVSVMLGKYAARATPMRALAACSTLLGLAKVGPAQQQVGRKPGGHFHGGTTSGVPRVDAPVVDLARRAPEQHRERASPGATRKLADRRHQRLRGRAGPIRPGDTRAPRPCRRRCAPSAARGLCRAPASVRSSGIQAPVERVQREVAAGHVADERGTHRFAPRLARHELRARGFGGAPVLAPEIELPGGAQHQPMRLGLEEIRGDGRGTEPEARVARDAPVDAGVGGSRSRVRWKIGRAPARCVPPRPSGHGWRRAPHPRTGRAPDRRTRPTTSAAQARAIAPRRNPSAARRSGRL